MGRNGIGLPMALGDRDELARRSRSHKHSGDIIGRARSHQYCEGVIG